jgi:processing peptidase subunit beta
MIDGNRCPCTYSVGVYIGAGSRQDTLETSGTSNMVTKMLLRGSQNNSKSQIAEEIESMGARIESDSSREMTHLNVTCFKNDVSRAVSLLGDAISNASFDAAELEIAKQEMAQAHEVSNRDQQEVLLEAAHFNAFRDHMLGQPKRGDADNLQNISVDMLNQYRSANFTGENMVVVGTGGIDHDALVDMVKEGFGGVQQTSSIASSDEKCVYTPSLLMMRDDEMYNCNVGVFYDAPSVNHEDYYSFQLMKHMIGNYDIQKNAEHLNDVSKQYNATH